MTGRARGRSRGKPYLSNRDGQLKEPGHSSMKQDLSSNFALSVNVSNKSTLNDKDSLKSDTIPTYSNQNIILHSTQLSNTPMNIPRGSSEIELFSNYFSVDVEPDWVIYQYCVTYVPEVVNKGAKQRLLYQHKDVIGTKKVFDGSFLYLPKQLDKKKLFLPYKLSENIKGEIQLQMSNRLTPESPQCVQIYNIIFRTLLYQLGMKEIGRNFYFPNSSKPIDKYSLEVMSGFTTSMQHCMGGLKLVVDTSFRVLCQKTAINDMQEIYDDCQRKKLNFVQQCKSKMIGKVVITRYNNRTYTIQDIDFHKTPVSMFEQSDGGSMKYCDYMYQHHGLKVQDASQPMMVTKPSKRKDMVLLIPECCNLTGIPDSMQANFSVMRELASHTRLNPQKRNQELLRFIKTLTSDRNCAQILKAWQINIPREVVRLKGIVLKPETLYLADNFSTSYNPLKADWSRETRNKKFMSPKHFRNWLFISDNKSQSLIPNILQTLHKVCPGMGIDIEQPQIVDCGFANSKNYSDALRREFRSHKYNFVVCLFPYNKSDTYNAVKKVCCFEIGVPSQCMVASNIRRMERNLMTYISKIAMLSSIKMGAELWHVTIPMTLMVIGIDTYHNSGPEGISVNAFVSSTNRSLTKYVSKVCFNHKYGEILNDISVCMNGSLRAYYEENNNFPSKILIYRDGVGDGQLRYVKNHELPQFYQACKMIDNSYEPEITLVVCQKRISARFSCPVDGALSNPPPGTVIADNITRTDIDDFFLISQTVNQGSVGPTHYAIVHAGIKSLTKDRLCTLTYKMCHLYYNWMGTVQVPAPCQYAHKMAYMVGNTLHKEPHPDLYNTLFYL